MIDKKTLRSQIEKVVRGEREFRRGERDRWVNHTPEYLAERAGLVKRWEEVVAEGEEKGFLVWTNDYPGSTLEAETAERYIDGKEFYESEHDYEARIKREVDRRLKHALEEAEKALKKAAGL